MHNEPDNEKQGSGVQPPDGSTERSSKAMFVARLEAVPKDDLVSPNWVLALLSDCDMLATREQPSVDRCVLTDERILWHWSRRDECLHGQSAVIWFARAIERAALAAVNQQASEPDDPKDLRVREALARLVALADEINKFPKQAYSDEWAERWDAAWEAARSALAEGMK